MWTWKRSSGAWRRNGCERDHHGRDRLVPGRLRRTPAAGRARLMSVGIVIALIDLVVVIVLIIRRVDVRLVLLAAAVPLFAVSGGLKVRLTKLVEEMANTGTVVPICTALGFAYVLRITECDQHLIRLLLRPLRHVRWLLILGGISAGYLVNTTIVSQTGTAAVLGP